MQFQQIYNSFKVLWDAVKPGGLYFIEDLQVSHNGYEQNAIQGSAHMVDIIASWVDQLLVPASRVRAARFVAWFLLADVICFRLKLLLPNFDLVFQCPQMSNGFYVNLKRVSLPSASTLPKIAARSNQWMGGGLCKLRETPNVKNIIHFSLVLGCHRGQESELSRRRDDEADERGVGVEPVGD